jgi:probable lipoprotein (TIGR04455 family)
VGDDGAEGGLSPVDDGAEVEVIARLLRCEDQVEVWVASAGGAWRSEDDDLTEIKRYWARVLGPEVEPWVVPTYRLLTATLETMPSPALPSEAWVREKIELGD